MKRTSQLFDAIIQPENLREAFFRAARGKRFRKETRAFGADLDASLRRLTCQLCDGSLPLGRCRQFVIRDPKERLITAPCFEERVLHHAIMGVCEPHFERWLIDDTFACRVGKGRLAALYRAQHFARTAEWFLKLDIRHYFDSIPHSNLLARLERRFKDAPLLTLFSRIIAAYRGAMGRGLPIGSLTSQHFANFYLGWFDRFVKEKLRVRGYVRYMDDMVLSSDDVQELRTVEGEVACYLDSELGLRLKPTPYINRSRHGVDFLGARVFPNRLVLNRSSRVRFNRKMLALAEGYVNGQVSDDEFQRRGTALIAHTEAGGLCNWHFRRKVVNLVAAAVNGLEPGEPGRELEQHRQELPVGEPQQEHAG